MDRIEVRLAKAAAAPTKPTKPPKPPEAREDAPIDDAKRMLARLTRDMRLCDAELDRVHQASELIADHHRASAKRLRPHLLDLHDGPTADEYEDHLRNAFQADTLANDGEYLDRLEEREAIAKAHQPSLFDADLMPVQKTVRRATGTHTQTYHVRRADPPAPIPTPATEAARIAALEPVTRADPEHYDEIPEEGTWRPSRMTTAIPLYRSVSLAEAADVLKRGSIRGGGNVFNPFDTRRHVFFGPSTSPVLLGSGEDERRQVEFAMHDSPLAQKHDHLYRRKREALEHLIAAVVSQWERINANRAEDEDGMQPITEIDGVTLDDLREARYQYVIDTVTRRIGRSGPIVARYRTLANIEDRLNALSNTYQQTITDITEKLKAVLKTAPFTSVVFRTRPMKGGLEYRPDKSGEGSGMSGEPEYAFPPDAVTLDDIESAYLVRNGTIEREVTLDELRAALHAFDRGAPPSARDLMGEAVTNVRVPDPPPLPDGAIV